jgi:hypothetical protein
VGEKLEKSVSSKYSLKKNKRADPQTKQILD